jgi:hypothetical protein
VCVYSGVVSRSILQAFCTILIPSYEGRKSRDGERDQSSKAGVFTNLVFPNLASATPYSSPKSSSRARNWSNDRPSRRTFSCRDLAKNCLSLREGSTSRGIFN